MTTPAAEVDVDSSARAAEQDHGPTRRRIETAPLSEGERRRVVDVVIGGYEYDARCPKLVVWNNMAEIVAEQNPRARSDRRRAGDREQVAEGRVTTDRIRLTNAMSHFLRGCLTSADWAAVEADLSDPDESLDIPDLWAAGIKLLVEFKPDMQEMAKSIGMKVPGVLDHLTDRIGEDGSIKDDDPKPAARASATRARKSQPRKRTAR